MLTKVTVEESTQDPSTQVVPELAAAMASPRRKRRFSAVVSYSVTIFLLVSLNFFLPRAMPGDPISAMLATASTSAGSSVANDANTRAALKRYYGLDRPVAAQYFHYLARMAHGDLGVSIRYNRPVVGIIGERLPWTLLLGGAATLVAVGIGSTLGVHAGWRRGARMDRGLLTFFTAAANFPPFFVASLALYFFSVKLGWVPLSGASTAFQTFPPGRAILDVGHHLVLPALVLGLQIASGQFLVMRSGMVSELGSDYLLMGRAKGLTEKWLKYRYAARNAILASVSLTALMMSFAVAGAVFVERVFSYPGIGDLTFQAANFRDYPLMQGTFLVLSLAVVTFNLAADLALGRLDPRTRR